MNKYNNGYINNFFDLRQNEVTAKYIKLEILKDLFLANDSIIQEKQKLLKIETNKLDELHEKVWILQNQICDEVWNFSEKHNFNTILNRYPEISVEFSLNCTCKVINHTEDDEEQNLLLEIQKLELDLENEKSNELREDLVKTEKELQECKEESYEIQKLKHNISETKRRVTDFKSKMQMEHNKLQIDSNFIFRNNVPKSSLANSSTSTTYFNEVNVCKFKLLNPIIHKNNNLKRKLTQVSDEPFKQNINTLQFVKASAYLKSRENEIETLKNTSCEKMITEAESNDKNIISSASVSSSAMPWEGSIYKKYLNFEFTDAIQIQTQA